LVIWKYGGGEVFIITPRCVFPLTDSSSPKEALFPPEDLYPDIFSKDLPFPKVTDRTASLIRPERQAPTPSRPCATGSTPASSLACRAARAVPDQPQSHKDIGICDTVQFTAYRYAALKRSVQQHQRPARQSGDKHLRPSRLRSHRSTRATTRRVRVLRAPRL
jgi:hypothetical protein